MRKMPQNAIKIELNGLVFRSVTQASEITGIKQKTIFKRLKSDLWPGWKVLEGEIRNNIRPYSGHRGRQNIRVVVGDKVYDSMTKAGLW